MKARLFRILTSVSSYIIEMGGGQKKKAALFIFHRDLRIVDNTALNAVLQNPEVDVIYPVFIFPPEQIDPVHNPYFSHKAVRFMCESLASLDAAIRSSASAARLCMIKGDIVKVLDQILSKNDNITTIYFNEDYSKYAIDRDARIKELCQKRNIAYETREDYLLWGLGEGLREGKPYVILSQFYNKYLKECDGALKVARPVEPLSSDLKKKLGSLSGAGGGAAAGLQVLSVSDLASLYMGVENRKEHGILAGGREDALKRIKYILPRLSKKYGVSRDIFADEEGTSRMSAYLKFGCVSVREFYWECVGVFKTRDHPLIRELVFREFYTKIYGLRPELQRNVAYLDKLDRSIKWLKADGGGDLWLERWNAWTNGKTGYPLVDAAMRQLAATGYTHNRARMVQGSFATRYLGLDWRDCARFYASKLADVCPFVNVASWQWCAGVGVDAMYYRAPLSPILQAKRFDADCTYIKRWLPELADVPAKDIIAWSIDERARERWRGVIDYPEPIVDAKLVVKENIAAYKKAAAKAK